MHPEKIERPGSQPQEKEEEKTPEKRAERLELHDRLAAIIRVISGKMNLEVTTEIDPPRLLEMLLKGEDPNRAWYRATEIDPRTKRVLREFVRIPEEIFEAREDVAKGKAAHEAGHVRITRHGEFIPDEVLQELGFHSLISSAEERPTDQIVRERYEGAGTWVDAARRDNVEEALLIAQSKAELGYMPKFLQLCDLIVHGPHYPELPEFYDREVIHLYEKIRPFIEQIERTLPEEGSNEKMIVGRAKERYNIVYSKVWPEVKKLVIKDIEKESLRQMIQESMRQGRVPEGEEKKDPLEGLPQDLKQELLSAIERAAKELEEASKSKEEKGMEKEGEKGSGEEGKSEKEKKAEAQGRKSEGEEGEKTDKGEKREKSSQEEGEGAEEPETKKESGRKMGKKQGEAEGSEDASVPMDELSQNLMKALQKLFGELEKKIQDMLKERAQSALEKIEDMASSELSGKLMDVIPETHKDYRARAKKEEEEGNIEEERERATKELGEIERRQAALQKNSSVYEKTYEKVRALDEDLYRRLEEIFTPNIKRQMKLRSSGARLNLPALFRWEAGKGAGSASIDNRIFESLHLPEKKDYAFTILVDLSASMSSHGKINETFKGVVLLAEVLNRLGVKNEILGFQDEVIIFKTFDEDLSDEIRRKISGMIDEVYSKNPGGHNAAGFNDDGPCLLEASKGLESQPGKEKFLLVLSDGIPMGRRSGIGELTDAVKKILETTSQKLVGIGLGNGTAHVKNFYPNSLPDINVKQLQEVLGNLLEDMLRNPEKYAFSKGN